MLKYLVWRKAIDRIHLIVDTVPDRSQQVALKSNLKQREPARVDLAYERKKDCGGVALIAVLNSE